MTTHDFRLLVDGQLVPGAATFGVINPATAKVFAQCPKADAALLERAVGAAKRAFPGWSATPIDERARLVGALADALEARTDEFARLLTTEQGKPLPQATYEIMGSVGSLRSFAAMRPETRVIRESAGGGRVMEVRRPLGVVAAIMPWNFPLLLLMNKLAPALVSGNTIVAKPAPTTPLTTLLFGEICAEVLPAGVVNILADENELGPLLTGHPDIAKVSFTGSTATGARVMQSAAASIKRVTLELGGNDAAIVLDDADPQVVAGKVFAGAMANSGQVCVAIKRVYVPETLYDAVCDELARLAKAAIVDDGMAQGAQMGPVQNRMQFEKLVTLLEEVRGEGKVLAGGAPLDRPGYFIPPTILRDLPASSRLVEEEQFGPVLPVMSYSNLDDVIVTVNASPYGLGGSVWSADIDRALQVAMRLESGTVWINQHMAVDNTVPFRGAKQSGLGGELGQEGLNEYSQPIIINAVGLTA